MDFQGVSRGDHSSSLRSARSEVAWRETAHRRGRHEHASGLAFVTEEKRHRAISWSRRDPLRLAVKRGMDLVLAGLALFLLLPLLLMVAIAIRVTSPGPALFVQWRPGRGGRLFPMLKFRTMHIHLADASGVRQTVDGDRRVTRFGAWLRRTSVDELPQLLNILAGHMSLVGPRPHPAGMLAAGKPYEALVPYYHLRLDVRPGLSGWAQVNSYRGPTSDAADAIARIEHDLAYIQNFSLRLDIRIIIETIHREFMSGTGS